MKKIAVLGAGMVGRAMAIDLSKNAEVWIADIDDANLKALSDHPTIHTTCCDLKKDDEIRKFIRQADLVIGAVPGHMGFKVMETVINEGKNMVDISFFPEDPFLLDELARKKDVTVVMDCGVAPGMDNMILGYYSKQMEVERFECLVGGLPVVRSWPYQYKAPFSPIDVIEEYIRPARIVIDGQEVIKEALSEPELLHFDNIGTLEAFNTDGLRSLVKTMNVPNMIERTLRYPGHIEYMKVLRETGYFSKDPVQVGGASVRPIDLTARLLFPKWKYSKGEEEFTVMRVVVEGSENGKKKRITYDLYDRYDIKSQTSSMARTTGYTCTAVANLLLNGIYDRKGISPPEYVGMEGNCLLKVLLYLQNRNVNYTVKEESLIRNPDQTVLV